MIKIIKSKLKPKKEAQWGMKKFLHEFQSEG